MSQGRNSVSSERGSAIVLVLLSLVIISGLAAAMAASGRAELLITRNQERAAQGRAAAEAGLNHAIEVTQTYLTQWQANGFTSRAAAMDALFRGPDNLAGTAADNGSLELLGIARPPARVTLSGAPGAAYEARVFDEDDPARGVTLTLDDRTRIGENGNATTDGNLRIVIRATGYAPGDASATLEATIGPVVLPAIITNGSLSISADPTISGSNGSVHANGDLTIAGSPVISQNATASGTYSATGSPTIGGQAGGGRPIISVPAVRAIDHRPLADFVLTSTGRLTNLGGTVICDASSNPGACAALGYGWVFNGPAGWGLSNNGFAGTYYVEGHATISGDIGTVANPLAISVIATGNIDISGTPRLRPDLPELMFVTDMDLKIGGDILQPQTYEGQMLVHEQLMILADPSLAGQIIVENAPSVSTLVVSNSITGTPTIVYNGMVGSNTYAVTAWREVR